MDASLEAISPVDGRYSKVTAELKPYFSEFALFKFRVQVEVEYLIRLASTNCGSLSPISDLDCSKLRNIYNDFSIDDAKEIKKIEQTTNHDIKAVEYFVKQKLEAWGMQNLIEFVHFGLTSQDINNTAIPLSLKLAAEEVMFPAIHQITNELNSLAEEWASIPMLARTHGQPASPTSLGKEFKVFTERLEIQTHMLESTVWAAKFGGATGNLNAHKVAFPDYNWPEFSNLFLEDLGLYRSRTTTQIEHYDHLSAFCQNMIRVNLIMIDFCRDIWTYISMEYFRQKVKAGETGSSAMPHKVNPIDFENAEGNLGLANALFDHLAMKLPVSRLQRDLTDSTVLRNLGMPLAHSLIAYKSLSKGLSKLLLNKSALEADLNKHASVIAEAIQTVLRREGYPKPYEALKELTRGKETITMDDIHSFIDQLQVSDAIKFELKEVSPQNYTGYSFS
ncbi:MAG: adenylosuccinate lyase [Bacteroidia bacterium]